MQTAQQYAAGRESQGLRLAEHQMVQAMVADALERVPPGPVRVVSLCAGQGRDLLGVLADHPRRGDVTARLVELDPGNADAIALRQSFQEPDARAWCAPASAERAFVYSGRACTTRMGPHTADVRLV
jgi:hypothetical protein